MCCTAAWLLLLLHPLLRPAVTNLLPCGAPAAGAAGEAEASSGCCSALLLLLQLLDAWLDPPTLMLLLLLRGLTDALGSLLGVSSAEAAAACGRVGLSLHAVVVWCTHAQQQLHAEQPQRTQSLQEAGSSMLLMVLTLLPQAKILLFLLPAASCGCRSH
jgi:hypothetical protein